MNKLNALITKGETQRLADPQYLYELRALVRSQSWPWNNRRLDETFSDGNITANPVWQASGDVRANWNGLRMVHIPRQGTAANTAPSNSGNNQTAEEAIGGLIFDILSGNQRQQQQGGSQQQAAPDSQIAVVSTGFALSNAFAMQMEISSSGPAGADRWIEFGPYQGTDKSVGYRLIYAISNQQPRLELVRVSTRGSSIIDVKESPPALEGGGTHVLEWRRSADGTMVVLLDNVEMINTRDMGFRSAFDGLTIVNRVGDYSIRRITVDGT